MNHTFKFAMLILTFLMLGQLAHAQSKTIRNNRQISPQESHENIRKDVVLEMDTFLTEKKPTEVPQPDDNGKQLPQEKMKSRREQFNDAIPQPDSRNKSTNREIVKEELRGNPQHSN